MGNIKKFAGSLLVSSLFAVAVRLVVQALFGAIFNEAFMWLVRAVGIIAYFFLIYHEGWTHGAADYNLVLYNRAPERKWKGEVAGIFAAIPSVILAVGMILVQTGVLQTVFFFDQDIVVVICRLWNAPLDILVNMHPALYFVQIITLPIIAGLGYRLGFKQIRLSDYIYYARGKDE